MRFWDSSAIVALLVREARSVRMGDLFAADPQQVVWWATPVEATSAIARLEREHRLPPDGTREALDRLAALGTAWHEVQPSDRVRRQAARLLRVHPVRAADALQLAAAIVVSEDDPTTLAFVTLDERLAEAAEREGFGIGR